MSLELTDHEQGILTGLVISAFNEAGRDSRTGPWVDALHSILTKWNHLTNEALWKVAPTGGEPFGTKVTFWSAHWGTRHAVITRSPKPANKRDRFDSTQWQIVIKGSGMTHAPADQLTLGWHPDHFTEEGFN